MTEKEARRWPDLWAIVEARVKPERMSKDAVKYPRMVNEWWRYWMPRFELYETIAGLDVVLVCSRVGNAFAFCFVDAHSVLSDRLVVFPFESFGAFAVLQSRAHEAWARFTGSTLKDDLLYNPTDCFGTFPFPEGFETDLALEAAGKTYYEFRAALMVRNNEGLTKTYNRFHDPDETSPDILKLRDLHAAMDRAVLDAYGWTDIDTACEFLLDYEEDDDDAATDTGKGRKKRKPYRYRWPDAVRDEVLARLLKLNAERAEAERQAGAASSPESRKSKATKKTGTGKKAAPKDDPQLDFQ
jgi:hypothetical protein